jgi:hypothetical protein
MAARKLIMDADYRQDDPVFHVWRGLFFQNPEGYRLYVDLWNEFKLQALPGHR